jgi:hypothetical protein
MPVEGSTIEPYPHAVKAKHTDNGIVKFPVNVHSLLVERSQSSGYTRVIAKQNDTVLSFVLDDEDCQHLVALLTPR